MLNLSRRLSGLSRGTRMHRAVSGRYLSIKFHRDAEPLAALADRYQSLARQRNHPNWNL